MTMVVVVSTKRCDLLESTNHLNAVIISIGGEAAIVFLKINENTLVIITTWWWVKIVSTHVHRNFCLHIYTARVVNRSIKQWERRIIIHKMVFNTCNVNYRYSHVVYHIQIFISHPNGVITELPTRTSKPMSHAQLQDKRDHVTYDYHL